MQHQRQSQRLQRPRPQQKHQQQDGQRQHQPETKDAPVRISVVENKPPVERKRLNRKLRDFIEPQVQFIFQHHQRRSHGFVQRNAGRGAADTVEVGVVVAVTDEIAASLHEQVFERPGPLNGLMFQRGGRPNRVTERLNIFQVARRKRPQTHRH